jgi:hypothetical protein
MSETPSIDRYTIEVLMARCRELERRLTVAETTLACIASCQSNHPDDVVALARKALNHDRPADSV